MHDNWQPVVFLGYGMGAVLAAMAYHFWAPSAWHAQAMPWVVAVVVFFVTGFTHLAVQYYHGMRRINRRLLALKRAIDDTERKYGTQTGLSAEVLRDEPAKPARRATPELARPAASVGKKPAPANPPPPLPWEEEEAAPPSDEAEDMPVAAPPPRARNRATLAPPSSDNRSLAFAAPPQFGNPMVDAEMRVLHSLIQQLYAQEIPEFRAEQLQDGMAQSMAPSAASSAAPAAAAPPQSGNRAARAAAPQARPSAIIGVDDGEILARVRDALRDERIGLFLQPIVSLPQRKRRFYECLGKIHGHDGVMIAPERYRDIAAEAGLLSALDNMFLFRTVQKIRRLRQQDPTAVFFCPIGRHSLENTEFRQDFFDYIKNHDDLSAVVVLLLPWSILERPPAGLMGDLNRLAERGFRFALQEIPHFPVPVERLRDMACDFLLVSSAILVDQMENIADAAEVRAAKQAFDRQGVDVIATHIETEQRLLEMLDINMDYGQGFLFGSARPASDYGFSGV